MESEAASSFLFLLKNNYNKQIIRPTNIYSSYLSFRITLDYLAIFPIVSYGFFLTYIIHISKGIELSSRKINKKTLNLKKKSSIIATFYFFYQFILIFYLSYDDGSADVFLFLFLQLIIITNTILTPMVIKLISKKIFQIPFRNFLFIFWVIISIKILIEMIIEFSCGIYFKLITFSSIGLLSTSSLAYFLYKYPRDDQHPSNNEVYYELQFLPLLSQDNYNNYNKSYKRLDKQFSSSSMKKFKSVTKHKNLKSPKSTITKNIINQNDISLDDLSQNIPELLPHYPKIEIQIKGDYKYYKTNLTNDFDQFERDFFDNFYFRIVVKISEMNISHTIRRNINEFLELEQDIKSEFSFKKYSRKLSENLPHLKLPRNYKNVDFFKNFKINFEMFLKNIVNESCYITDEVLDFLDINDENLFFSYDLIRKKNLNVNRIIDDTILMSKKLNFLKDDDDYIRESVIRIKNDFNQPRKNESRKTSYFTSAKFSPNFIDSQKKNLTLINLRTNQNIQNNNVKINILEIKREFLTSFDDFNIVIRISKNNMFRIFNKKLSEVVKMINELSNLNKNNENIKNILKMFSNMDEVHQNFITIKKLNSLLENVLQNSFDNLKIYHLNQIINDFFFEFLDESKTISRTESFVTNHKESSPINVKLHTNNFFLSHYDKTSPVSNEKKIFENSKNKVIKKDNHFYQNLINQNKIKSIEVSISNYIFLAIEFKAHVFYVTDFKLILIDGNEEEIHKKYKFKELNEFVNLFGVGLKISNKLEYTHNNQIFKTVDNKLKFRKEELQKNLNTIFVSLNNNLEENKEWGELLKMDRKYQLIKIKKHTREISLSKPSIIFKARTESKESFLGLNIRDSIL